MSLRTKLLLIIALYFMMPLYPIYAFEAKVSWYGDETCKYSKTCRTANGEQFDKNALTTACWSDYKFGTKFKVTYKDKSVVVRCTDRGAFKRLGRFLDLSEGAFTRLESGRSGVLKVNVEIVE